MHGTLHREPWQCPTCIAKAPVERMQCIISTRLTLFSTSSFPLQTTNHGLLGGNRKTHFRLVRQFMWLATREAPAVNKVFEWEGGRDHDTDDMSYQSHVTWLKDYSLMPLDHSISHDWYADYDSDVRALWPGMTDDRVTTSLTIH